MRFLVVEDSEDDVLLLTAGLRSEGLTFDYARVETASAMAAALAGGGWDVVLCDYNLPQFSAPEALELLHASGCDVPFIVVSGTIGEDTAVEIMRAGAHDYFLKGNLKRLGSSILREIQQAKHREAERRARAELEASERRFRSLFEQASDLIVLAHIDGRFLDANRAALESTGYGAEELPSIELRDVMPDGDLVSCGGVAAFVGQTRRQVTHIRRKDGSIFPAEIGVRVLAGGQVLAIARDITEQLAAKARLEEYVKQQSAVAELGGIAIATRDVGSLLNAACRTVVDTLAIDFCGFARVIDEGSSTEFVTAHGADADLLARHRRTPSEESQALYTLVQNVPVVVDDWNVESRFRPAGLFRESGFRSGLSVVVTGRTAPAGVLLAQTRERRTFSREDVLFVRSIATLLGDAIERSRSDEALRASEAALARAQKIAAVGNWTWNVHSGRVYWSPEAARIFGRDPEETELKFDAVTMFIHPDDRTSVMEQLLAAVTTRSMPVLEYRTWPRSGPARIIVCHGEPWIDEEGEFTGFVGTVQDVTDRRGTEELLHQREQEFRTIVESSPDVITRLDRDHRFLYMSPAIERVSALRAREFIGKTSREIGLEAAASKVLDDTIDHVLESGEEIDFEFTLPLRRGARDFHCRAVPEHDKEGRPSTVLAILRDITERKESERALKRSEARYRSLFEQSRDSIYTIDREGIITSANPSLLALGGWSSAADVVGHDVREFVHPDEVPNAERDLQLVFSGQEAPVAEYRVRASDGTYVDFETRTSPALEDGEVKALIGIGRDITDRRRHEAERERLSRELQLLLESTYEGICAIDPEGICTLVNRAAAEMLGYDSAQILGRAFHELVHDTELEVAGQTCILMEARTRLERLATRDLRLRRADGSVFPAQIAAAPMISGGTTHGAVLTFTDITRQRAIEKELERAGRLSALGKMAATVAHEFNNVLMGIQPFAEVLRKKSAEPSASRAVEQILKSVQRGRRVTDEILRFTRRPEPVRRPISSVSFFVALENEIRAIVPPEIEVNLVLEAVDLALDGDQEQLGQLFMNLAVNARDAMSAGGTVSVVVGDRCPDACCGDLADRRRYAHVLIRDTGQGIPAAALEHVFEPFFTTKRRGTGLGLPIAHQIVTAHEGHILIDSREGVGTAVHILLPLSARAVEPEIAAPVPPRPQAGRSAYVLIVEDEEAVAIGTSELLQLIGVESAWAEEGEAALALARARRPDAVVLDLGLPGEPGTAVFARLRALYPDLPIVFATGHGDEGQLAGLLSQAGVAFLRKPFEFSALETLIDQLLGAAVPSVR